MTQHNWQRYLARYLQALLLLSAVVAGFHAIVDPRARVLFIDSPGFNQVKVALPSNSRGGKANALRQCGYDNVILGTSRVENALRTTHPAFGAGKTYNAGLQSASMYELRRLAAYAMRAHKPHAFVLGLDFFSFSANFSTGDDFADSPLPEQTSIASMARYLLSSRTLRESLSTLSANIRGKNVLCADDGSYSPNWAVWSARKQFDYWINRSTKETDLRYERGDEHFAHLAALLQEAAAADIEVYAFIPPVHATLLEWQRELGMREDFADWKRRLVETFATVNAGLPPDKRFVLWDFSAYNEYTTEPIPSPDAAGAVPLMRWFNDPSHCSPAVGDKVLDRMMGATTASATPAGSFGLPLTADNVEAVIADELSGSAEYRRNNPAEIQRMQRIISNPE